MTIIFTVRKLIAGNEQFDESYINKKGGLNKIQHKNIKQNKSLNKTKYWNTLWKESIKMW